MNNSSRGYKFLTWGTSWFSKKRLCGRLDRVHPCNDLIAIYETFSQTKLEWDELEIGSQFFETFFWMVSCGGILCGVGVFLSFMILTEMIESQTELESQSGHDITTGGVVFSGEYKYLRKVGDEGQSELITGRCQLRGISRPVGAADIAISSLDLRLQHDSAESEVSIHSGILLEKEDNVIEFFGKGQTEPLMFSLHSSPEGCALNEVKILFRHGSGKQVLSSIGEISSTECHFKITFELVQINLNRLKRKIVNYSIVSNAITLGLIKLYIDQIRLLDSNTNFSRVALGTVVIQSVTDSLDSMLNFFVGLSIQFLFNIFIIISLFKFILFSFFEMRLLILAWRQLNANDINTMDPYDSSRMERNWIQTRLYLPLVGALCCLMLYPSYTFVPLAIASQLYWVPQIVHDAIKGHKSPLTPRFIIGVTICRLVLPLYIWACPDNIFNGDMIPAPTGGKAVAWLIVVLQVIQVGLLLAQRLFGPRCFVPWIFLPHVYNYYRKIDMDEEFGVPECVVCMSEIELRDNRKNTVITPCGHLFHSQCLSEWMNLRLECPLCRRELPPIT
jgi:hypothetical protein